MSLSRRRAALLLFGGATLCACGGRSRRLVIGSKSSTEQQILGEILAQYFEKRFGRENISRRLGLTSTMLAHDALLAGEIDIYPEYSGAALTAIFKLQPEGTREAVREQVKENYRVRYQCEWFGPLGFENPFALVILRETAEKQQIRTMSGAAAYLAGWSLGMLYEFQDRPDGLTLFMRNYRLHLSAPLHALDASQLYSSLDQSQSTMVAGNSTDAALTSGRYVVLADDKNAFPPYEAGLAVKAATLERIPELASLLRAFNGKISGDKMREMIRRADLGKTATEVVAAEFLQAAGL